MAIALVTSTSASSSDAGETCVTSAINTTGASLLVVGLSFDYDGGGSVSDSKSNTWNALTISGASGGGGAKLFYATNPTVGSGHTFSAGASFLYASIFVLAFSGAKTTSPFDQQNGASGDATTLATGSVTPSENNEVLVTVLEINGAGLPVSINSSFIKQESKEFSGGNAYGGSIAYLIQTTAGAVNPTWTRTNSNPLATRIATFKAPASASAKQLAALGVG